MIITNIIGGLGNQMFQYAAGRMLAKRHNTELKLFLGGYKTFKLFPFLLHRLNMDIKVAGFHDIVTTRHYSEPSLAYDPTFESLPDGTFLAGYWQCEKYFLPIRKELQDEFLISITSDMDTEVIQNIDVDQALVAVHVRRGDRIIPSTKTIYGIKGPDYYLPAIRRMYDMLWKEKDMQPLFLFFSDDICMIQAEFEDVLRAEEKRMPEAQFFFMEKHQQEPEKDLALMSACDHFIFGNSTFAWWAAWLNDNSDKLLYFPDRWTLDPTRNSPDIIPVTWDNIDNQVLIENEGRGDDAEY